jgi:indole-3-glycerol phosphate synthase
LPETQAAPNPDILDAIVASKRGEIAGLRPLRARMERDAAHAPAPRAFREALVRDRVAVIAEVKRRSPGAGEIRPRLSPAEWARRYRRAGAAAMSVLTDGPFFGGSLTDLRAARGAVDLPLLRKDFTLDPIQVLEARGAGADAVLLIVRILDDRALRLLREEAEALGMAALVEVHGAGELERALESGASLVGINNRDLTTFDTDLAVTEGLLEYLPDDGVVVSESGIATGEDVARLGAAGVHGVLVGEAILRAEDPSARVRELAGQPRVPRDQAAGGGSVGR